MFSEASIQYNHAVYIINIINNIISIVCVCFCVFVNQVIHDTCF